jgi:hypothetical protein
MSMALFPFIALPVAEKVFGVRLTDAFTRRLVEHSTRLFYEGVGSNPSRIPAHAAGPRRRTT